jgi:hypothetical protein
LFIVPEDDKQAASKASLIPDFPMQYIRSSDMNQTHRLRSRLEGEFILSYKTSAGWVAITKDILTEVLAA